MSIRYLYELRRGDKIIATGHLSREEALEVGDEIVIGTQHGIVRTVEPMLYKSDFRLVVQLTRGGFE